MALGRLVSEGALDQSGPKTTVVPNLMLPAVREIAAIRLRLEGLAAELAAPVLGVTDVTALEAIQHVIDTAYRDGDHARILAHNRAFHFLIYERADQAFLLQTIRSCWIRIGPALHALYPSFKASGRGPANHAAAKARDAGALRSAIEQDIRDRLAAFERVTKGS